ncbi:hypothetical protein Tco_1217429 [Tanacetum coccineum]
MRQGWDPRYKIWVEHDEPASPTPPPVIDNTRQPLMSDMTALLNDLSYIPPNNEHNEPTQGDIGETSNEPTQATRNEFEELYASANKELYPGSDYVTRLPILRLKGDNNKDLDFCPVCNTSRWKDSNTPGKKVPKKVLRYFPIIPRLQRLYKSSHTAKDMIWHATGKCTEPGNMQHPVDGGAWKKFNTKYLDFAKEPRNVLLGLDADGFNPFGNLSQAYSMWPTLFDLRPHMDSSRWTEIYEGINMHFQKAYNTNKASFKAKHWKADPTIETYDVENLARAAQNWLNWQKSVVTSRQGSRSLARLRDEMRQASDTQEYPSFIDTFWRTHTIDGVFPKDEDRRIYEEMKRLEATGEYTEDEINALARGGKLHRHIPGVGRVLPSRATSRPNMPTPDKSLKSMHRKEFESGGASWSGGCGDDEESSDDEDGDGDDYKAFKDDQYFLATQANIASTLKILPDDNHTGRSSSLNDLDNATLHIDGQSTEVDAPPYIIDRATGGCPPPPQSTVDPADVEKLKKSNKSLTKQVKMMIRLFRSDDKFSQMLDQFESSPEFGGANGSDGCGDDEDGDDEDGDDEDDDEDEEDDDS